MFGAMRFKYTLYGLRLELQLFWVGINIKYWNQRRYTAWFDPDFPIESADYSHADENDRLRVIIAELKEDIRVNGLQNPLLVTIKDNGAVIHPGKCRSKALLALGRRYAPAVVVDFRGVYGPSAIADGCTFLSDPEHVASYFAGDCQVEMSHRGLTVKKAR